MIKLIVSDIDGTLVPDGSHEMNPELLDVIMKIRENGVQFAAASGRQWASIESIFGPIKEKVFYLSDNGAYAPKMCNVSFPLWRTDVRRRSSRARQINHHL